MVATDLSKQQALDADPRAIKQINFIRNIAQQATIFLITEDVKDSYRFFTRNCKRTLNLKLSNSQLNRLKLGIKNVTEVTLKISSNIDGDFNDENNSPHIEAYRAFANNFSTNQKLVHLNASLELARIFNVASSINKFWNTKVLPKQN